MQHRQDWSNLERKQITHHHVSLEFLLGVKNSDLSNNNRVSIFVNPWMCSEVAEGVVLYPRELDGARHRRSHMVNALVRLVSMSHHSHHHCIHHHVCWDLQGVCFYFSVVSLVLWCRYSMMLLTTSVMLLGSPRKHVSLPLPYPTAKLSIVLVIA